MNTRRCPSPAFLKGTGTGQAGHAATDGHGCGYQHWPDARCPGLHTHQGSWAISPTSPRLHLQCGSRPRFCLVCLSHDRPESTRKELLVSTTMTALPACRASVSFFEPLPAPPFRPSGRSWSSTWTLLSLLSCPSSLAYQCPVPTAGNSGLTLPHLPGLTGMRHREWLMLSLRNGREAEESTLSHPPTGA